MPGISGFDLVRDMKGFKPELPAIMITAYSSEQGRQEAVDLGVHRYFQKPLDTDEMLTAVHTALYGDLVVYADEPVKPQELELVISDDVSKRLETLRTDTGASQITLATVSGQTLLQIGSSRDLNIARLITLMAKNLDNSFLLTQELGGNDPTTIQYHSGNKIELYIANVGRDYFLAIFLAQARRGRMGTNWVFAQRAIKDLLAMLPALDIDQRVVAQEVPAAALAQPDSARIRQQPALPSDAEEPRSDTATTPSSSDQLVRPEPSGRTDDKAEPLPDLLAPTESDGFFTVDEGAETTETADLSAFWDAAVIDANVLGTESGALSFEEARRQGLIPAAEDAGLDSSDLENGD